MDSRPVLQREGPSNRRNDSHLVVGNEGKDKPLPYDSLSYKCLPVEEREPVLETGYRPSPVRRNEGKEQGSCLHRNDSLFSDIFSGHKSVELDMSQLPSLLQEYLQITQTITDAKDGARLTAFLPALAVNIGNRVFISNAGSRIFPNIWTAIIGPSSTTRKTTSMNLAKQTLSPYEESISKDDLNAYAKQTLLLTNTTAIKLLNLLSDNPIRLFVINELSGFLAEMSKLYNSGMKQNLTDIFDGVSRSYFNMERNEYADKPSLSIMSSSVDGWFLSQIGNAHEQMSGFTQRFLYCVIGNVNPDELDTDYRDGYESCEKLRDFEEIYSVLRSIPGCNRLFLSEEAIDFRNRVYKEKMKEVALKQTDVLSSYFARIYDGYFFKFCIVFHLLKYWEVLANAMDASILHSNERLPDTGREPVFKNGYRLSPVRRNMEQDSCLRRNDSLGVIGNTDMDWIPDQVGNDSKGLDSCLRGNDTKNSMDSRLRGNDNLIEGDINHFFQTIKVDEATARQAMYLCDYYFENTLPLLTILSESGKLLNEKKFANLLNNRFNGVASHSDIMKYGHFNAKDMKTIVDTLLEMNIITMEMINPSGGKKGYRYHLNPQYRN